MKYSQIIKGMVPFLFSATSLAAEKQPPNVVLIMCDDLGYGDLGYTGAEDIKTPNIDQLAAEGIEFTNYYASAPTSSPTRCALMTGRYQARFKNLEAAFHMGVNHIGLPENEETLGRAFQRNGYHTALIGKWHLGGLPHQVPTQQGFDYFTGFLSGNIDYFTHQEKNGTHDLFEQEKAISSKEYMTDFIADRSIRYIQEYKNKPFLLYVAFNAPHWPYQGPDDGPCMADGTDWMQGSRERLVSMIEHTDKRIGDILRELKKNQLDENTIVIFTSDNGGDKFARNKPFSGSKGLIREGGIRVPLIFSWKENIKDPFKSNVPLITMDITTTLLQLTNTPFKEKTDGTTFYPLSSEQNRDLQNRPLFWRNGAKKQDAVRLGDFKMLFEKGKYHLYNLTTDPEEAENIADLYPDKLQELQKLYNQWEAEMPYKQTQFGNALKINQ